MKHQTTPKWPGRRKWQKGPFARQAAYQWILPYPFLLLCRLVDVTPEQVLLDFMDNLSHGSWNREGREDAKQHLVAYFLAQGYGNALYNEASIRSIFRELDALGMLFPKEGDAKLLQLFEQWRRRHEDRWFRYWYHRPIRKRL